jgi:hypothetical protein
MDKKKRKPTDINLIASSIVSQATGQPVKPADGQFDSEIVKQAIRDGKDPFAVLLGQRGGLKGGKARAKNYQPRSAKR